jgi:hypothetical protein
VNKMPGFTAGTTLFAAKTCTIVLYRLYPLETTRCYIHVAGSDTMEKECRDISRA